MSTYRGIIIGLGQMGKRHLRVLDEMDDVEIVAVIDRDPDQCPDGIPSYRDLSHMFNPAVNAEFVCIATPPNTLALSANYALYRNLHVMVEKPFGISEIEGFANIKYADTHQKLLAVGHVERYNPAVMELKRRLDDNEIGHIYQMHARRMSPYPDRIFMPGVTLDLATHDIDVMRYLSGSEIISVFAETNNCFGLCESEDLVSSTMRFDNDMIGLIEANWVTPTKIRDLTVTGTDGTFVVNYLTQELFLYQQPIMRNDWEALASIRGAGEGDMIRYAVDRHEPLRVQWDRFISALNGEKPEIATGFDGYAAMSTALAIQRSGRERIAVQPGYLENLPQTR